MRAATAIACMANDDAARLLCRPVRVADIYPRVAPTCGYWIMEGTPPGGWRSRRRGAAVDLAAGVRSGWSRRPRWLLRPAADRRARLRQPRVRRRTRRPRSPRRRAPAAADRGPPLGGADRDQGRHPVGHRDGVGHRGRAPGPSLADHVVVARLRAAGAVVVCRTATPELDARATTETPDVVTRRPWTTTSPWWLFGWLGRRGRSGSCRRARHRWPGSTGTPPLAAGGRHRTGTSRRARADRPRFVWRMIKNRALATTVPMRPCCCR